MQTGGPQAWAEFCLGYCKRLTLFLAIPAAELGCAAGPRRFLQENGECQSRLQVNCRWTLRSRDAFLRRFSARFSIARK